MYNIAEVNQSEPYFFAIVGNYISEFADAATVTVENSTGNDGTYIQPIDNPHYEPFFDGSKTFIEVSSQPPSSIADGTLTPGAGGGDDDDDGPTGIGATITASSHGFSDGDYVKITGVVGDAGDTLNGNVYQVADATENTFQIKDLDGDYVTDPGQWESGGVLTPVKKTFTGLTWLEGETVQILADGAIEAQKTVTNGTITLRDYFSKVHIGLPYTSELKPMKMAVETQSGLSRGKKMRIDELIVNFYKTLTAKWGQSSDKLDEIPFRQTSDNLGQAVPLFTGEKRESFRGGYDSEGDILIVCDQPGPMTVLSIMPSLGVYD